MKLPDDTYNQLVALMAEGLNWQQAAIWLRHKLGHPDERWLDELLDMASGIAGRAQQFAGQEREIRSSPKDSV